MIPGLIGMPRHAFLPFFLSSTLKVAGCSHDRALEGLLGAVWEEACTISRMMGLCVIDNRVNENQ